MRLTHTLIALAVGALVCDGALAQGTAAMAIARDTVSVSFSGRDFGE